VFDDLSISLLFSTHKVSENNYSYELLLWKGILWFILH